MNSKPWIPNPPTNSIIYPQSQISKSGAYANNQTSTEFSCQGIKEIIIENVGKLERLINDQQKVIQSQNKTIYELLEANSDLTSKHQNEIEEAKLEVKIQRDVNKQIRSTMQSLQCKYDGVCEKFENERKTVHKIEEELSLTKINQDAVMKKQLEKLKDQFKRMITSLERDRRFESSEDLTEASTMQNSTSSKLKNKNRNKKKGCKEDK